MKESIRNLPISQWNSLNPNDQGVFRMDPKLSYHVFKMISNATGNEYKKHQQDSKDNKDFYFGAQLTKEQKAVYDDNNQYYLVVNKVRKAIRSITGILTANKPKFTAIPTNDKALLSSKLFNKIFDWIWYNSKGNHVYRKASLRAIRDNIAALHLRHTHDNKIMFSPLSYNEFFADPTSKDYLFGDANYVGLLKKVDSEILKTTFGINNITTVHPETWSQFMKDDGTAPLIGQIYPTTTNWVTVYELYRKIPYIKDGFTFYRIVRETILGYDHMYRELLPADIKDYGIIPLASEDTENPYKYGEVHFLRKYNDFYNRAFSTLIYNAQILSNPKIIMKNNAFLSGDKSDFEKNFAKPGSVNVIDDDGNPIKDSLMIIGGQPLNQSFYTLKQDIDMEFEGATVPQQMTFFSSNNTQQIISRIDMMDQIMDRYKLTCSNFETSLTQLGIVSLQYFKGYMKDQKQLLLITDTKDSFERLSFNIEKGLDINDDQSVQNFIQQSINSGVPEAKVNQYINKLRDDKDVTKALTTYINNVDDLSYLIEVIPMSYSPTYEMRQLVLMRELQREGVVDAQAVLEKIPDADRNKIIKRISQINILTQQNQQLLAQLEEALKEIEKYKGKLTDLEIDTIIKEAQMKADYIIKDLRVKAYLDKVSRKIEKKMVLNEFEMKVKELLMVIEKNAKAQASSLPLPTVSEIIVS